ncbi:MAG: hypothetical protein J7604_17675 [Sporocytophaga sp.]|uniref:hypothetical protein n=1 Tax=Sporocytophaga sp. TaxID=2231183 RepID=UPI001B16974F|nr:hypothetical protein [Sporocytophaga sp.]MBO9702042.1 hypothetical protein [Sporocytophaga sp.]
MFVFLKPYMSEGGYKSFTHQNLLLVSADGGLLVLVDVSDKIKPFILSAILRRELQQICMWSL